MTPPRFSRPDVLVLAGGGILGEAWMTGVLAGLEQGGNLDMTRVDTFVGTSAGSIVAATLAAGESPRRPRQPSPAREPREDGDPQASSGRAAGLLRAGVRLGGSLAAPIVPAALALGTPAGSLVRSAVLARLPAGRMSLGNLGDRIERLPVRFDGRLRIVCVDRRSGRRVVFGSPGAPPARVSEAVLASCAIPSVFAPVSIGGRDYVDGGAWSFTNLDVAPVARDTQVLCLNPSAGITASLQSPLAALRGASRAAAAVEATALRRRGARVRLIGPDAASTAAMGANFMDPGPRHRVLAAGFDQGLELAAR